MHRVLSFFAGSMRCFIGILFCQQIMLAQAPPGYTYCANEGDSFTLPAKSDLAYGTNNQFAYLFNQTGTVTFSNPFFGNDPAPGVPKKGYYKLVDTAAALAALKAAILKIKNHLVGTSVLTPVQLNTEADIIQANISYVADDSLVVLQALDLVDCYDMLKGPIFINAATKGGFPNDFDALDGHVLVRAVFLVQQGILDYIFTQDNFLKYRAILLGRKFKTADNFPGVCPAPADTLAVFTAKINATMPKDWGNRTAFSTTPARRPTGFYLAPGSLGKVKVPAALVGKGFQVLVGAHSWDMKNRNNCRRFFRVTNTFTINDTITEIANPFGGGIYILVPYQIYEGVVDIQLTNVVPAPFFSAKISNQTTLQNWLDVQRTNPAPWADFETDKYMMQVPRKWIYNYADPVSLMRDWDDRMDVVSKMLGYPAIRSNTNLYLQVDVDIMHGFYGIGNPQINNTYDPAEIGNGNKNHWFLKPGVNFWETEFHEMGHAQLFSKFPGETEAAVNVPAAAIFNRLYKVNIDTALGKSFGDNPQITRDQAALNWMVTPNFRAGNAMDISNTTKDEVRYQQRGYGKYIEMAALFGWEMIDSFYRKENLDFNAQTPGDGLTEIDSRILRFSRTAGADLRPLVHFWGTHPKNPAVLNPLIVAENLPPSKLICDRLTHYKAILPADNAEFLTHANAFFGGSIPPGGHPDYHSGWYNIWKTQYNTSHGTLGKQAAQNIIDLYFPGGCPAAAAPPTVAATSQNICPGQSATLTASGAMYYEWSNGATGNSITVSPTATTTFTVVGKTAGVNSAPISATVSVNPLPIVSVENATICAGETAILTATGADNFQWSNGETSNSINISPTATTTFSVVGTSLGCAAAPVFAQINVNPLPIVSVNDATICAGETAILTANGASNFQWSNGETGNSINVNPSATSTFSVVGTSLGCAAAPVFAEIEVNPLPIVGVNNATICAGETAILTANGASNFEWSNGETGNSINISPSATSTFSVVGTSLGCAAAPVFAEIEVNPLPIVSVNNATICAGETAILTATGASNFQWSNGETGNSINISPTATSIFSVVGTSLGCAAAPVFAQISVNPLPIVSVNNATICAGDTAVLTANGATNFQWSNGETGNSINVNPTATATFSVIGTSLGCAAAPVSAQIDVNPLPIVSVNDATICAGETAILTATGADNFEWSNGQTGNSINGNPTATTTFSVVGTSLGCAAAPVFAQVLVNPLPIVSVENATICAGETAILTATGADNFEWSNGETGNSITVSPTETTTFSVIGTTLGCSDSEATFVTVSPLPTVNLGADILLPTGQNAILNAFENGATYQWSTGATTATIAVNSMGIYSVTVTNSAGCTASDEILVTVIVSTGDQNERFSLSIMPNPTRDLVHIICLGSATSSAQVIDNLGRTVVEDNAFLNDGATRILNIGHLPPGTYFLNLTTEKNQKKATLKILKQ